MFGEIIRSFRKQSGLSQLNFVNALQKSSSNFDNLDVVTLSRWERGATKPHLNRQNEILDMLGVDIFDVWSAVNDVNNLPDYTNRINNHGYFNESGVEEVELIVLNATNLDKLGKVLNLVDAIFEYEENAVLKAMESQGLTRESIVMKIINQYGGELTIAVKHGQILGHLFSVSYSLATDFLGEDMLFHDKNVHFILSFNCSHIASLVETLSREVYRYIHSLDPNTELVLYVNNPVIFNLFFSLSFEYRSVSRQDVVFKLMNIDIKTLKSQRVWMNLLSQYKDKHDV
ncbi:sequence-specific DNA binding [Vibrio sp. B1FIG11]|uniref:helix-turn-helix domain-containing protein n=1 Tax=Vibrio sp. B1FIG11 TaxID=2751177 RepID=UPI001AF0B298|nr:helix-turn-helix transcriptional regulator [Vibrio sp. B1FIG11]CAD7809704.1 sequence-specific DNA binding [Vibrio sp. B1FIG11]CAE6910039.1 sequence-specific DNA binding [Vibrio sp. B1FIG11]